MLRGSCFWLIVAISVLGSCKKTTKPAPAPPDWTPGTDVYFVGQNAGQAVYWKNGSMGGLGQAGIGEGIAVSGSDVYVGGASFKLAGTTFVTVAALWKNGTELDLTDTGTAYAYTPVISGADVYVPGYINRAFQQSQLPFPVYWKNAQRFELDSLAPGQALSMAVTGSDVYAVGGTSFNNDTALVWKNGQRLAGTAVTYGQSYVQIAASGGNIYVVGDQGYLVNSANQFNFLQNAYSTNGLFLDGPDIYVAGQRLDSLRNLEAAYWKNGQMVTLPNFAGTTFSTAAGVAVAGQDVYVEGTAFVKGAYWGVYWKNGVEGILTRNGGVYGVALGN